MSTVDERIPLSGPYALEVTQEEARYRLNGLMFVFRAVKDDEDDTRQRRHEQPTVEVCPPLQVKHGYMNREWAPTDETEYGYITSDQTRMTVEEAQAVAAMLVLATDLLTSLHRAAADKLLEQDRLRAAHLEAELKATEARDEARDSLKEELQWYIGQQFKLKREGYRATVFGTVKQFSDTRLYSISERGVPMDTRIDDIYFFAIKYEGEKRYTTIYEREPQRRA